MQPANGGKGNTYAARIASEHPPSSELWQKLFPGGTQVRRFALPKVVEQQVYSYPSKHVSDFLADKFAEVAKSPLPPNAEEIADVYSQINVTNAKTGALDGAAQIRNIVKQTRNRGATVVAEAQRATRDFVQLAMFHAPTLSPKSTSAGRAAGGGTADLTLADYYQRATFASKPPPPRPKVPTLDFHQAVAALGGHPQLMRMLGLVIDLEFDVPGVLVEKNSLVSVRLTFPESAKPRGYAKAPVLRTHCRFGSSTFHARARGSEIENGMLKLGNGEYRLEQIDLDDAGMKTFIQVNSIAQATRPINGRGKRALPAISPPPAFRTAGVAIMRNDRAAKLNEKFERQKNLGKQMLNPDFKGTIDPLFQEDITRGYAWEVTDADKPGQWYSLCEREGEARFTADPEADPVEIGRETAWVATGVVQAEQVGDPKARVGEAIARWSHGWSMVAARPGKRIRPDETVDDGEQEIGNIKLAVKYWVPNGSLPPQRFGRSYRFRARAVDLAGNVTPTEVADAAGEKHVLGPDVFRRQESISPPSVIPRKPATEGESAELLVLRSDPDAGGGAPTSNERHVYPPTIDQFAVEAHGMLDRVNGSDNGLRGDLYGMITAREGKNVETHPDAQSDGKQIYIDADRPEFPVESGTALMPGLPDPLAKRIYLANVPGASGEPFAVDLYRAGAQWPNVEPFRLLVVRKPAGEFDPPRLENSAGQPDQKGHVLRIGLPEAEDITVRLSSVPDPSDIDELGPWQLIKERSDLSASELADLRQRVERGEHWAVTPRRTLRLVHAVRRPLRATDFRSGSSGLRLERSAGETFVTLIDEMKTSRKSTERVDVKAKWFEIRDHVDKDGNWLPELAVPVGAHVFQKKIERSGSDDSLPISERHDIGHTRHIPEIGYETVATTRFAEYFAERTPVTFQEHGVFEDVNPEGGVAPGTEVVTSQDGKTTYSRGEHYEMDYGDGKIRSIALPLQETITVKYVAPEITRSSDVPTKRRARSSARPDAPKVLYAVPTFKRESVTGRTTTRAHHEPVGMRVYLDRPWWSSGADERLGVVVWPHVGGDDGLGGPFPSSLKPELRKIVSQRGQDPIWGSASTPGYLRPEDFGNRIENETRSPLRLVEAPKELVAVVSHAVHPDYQRRLWYCDIDILPGSAYTPFVRLALVRYQPHSVPGVEVSPVVPLDFMQLYPSRTATVVRGNETNTISVSGRTYRDAPEHVAARSVIEVTAQARRDGMVQGDDAIGWDDIEEPVELSSQTAGNGITTWTGTVPTVRGFQRARLVVREYELFANSSDASAGTRRRLVYAEAIEL